MRAGLGLALGLEAALENVDSWPSGLSCIAAPRGLSCTTAPSPRSMLARETGESSSCRRPVVDKTLLSSNAPKHAVQLFYLKFPAANQADH